MADQVPYFAFFDPGSDLYFTWKANAPVIEVRTVDRTAEVIDTIPLMPRATVANASAQRWMDWFKLVCCNYIRLKAGDKEESKP